MEDVWPVGAVISMGPLRVRVEGEVGSTHEDLWARRRWVEDGTGMAAESQTAGVGRSGHRWVSPPGGLYVSVLVGGGMPVADLDALGQAASLAAIETAAELLPGAEVFLKWPNDVVVRATGSRVGKLAGVVVRAESVGDRVSRAVVSVGLNVSVAVEGAGGVDGPTVAASLEGIARRGRVPWEATRAQALEWLVGFMAVHLGRARVDPGAVRARYAAHLRRAPLRAKVAGVREKFRPAGVARGGALQVRRASGRTAEVSLEDSERLMWAFMRPLAKPARTSPARRGKGPRKAAARKVRGAARTRRRPGRRPAGKRGAKGRARKGAGRSRPQSSRSGRAGAGRGGRR